MKFSMVRFFRRDKSEKKYIREAELCRKIAEVKAYKQRLYLKHNFNMCMGFNSWNMRDISMR